MRASTWWCQGHRIHISGSFGEFVLSRIAEQRLVAIDDDLAKLAEGLLQGSQKDVGDLHYFIFGHVVRADLQQPHVEVEVEILHAMERALFEHVDLSVGHVFVSAHQRVGHRLDLASELLAQRAGEAIKLPSGIVLFHRVVPHALRVKVRERAAWRARMVDEAVAALAARRAAQRSARAA